MRLVREKTTTTTILFPLLFLNSILFLSDLFVVVNSFLSLYATGRTTYENRREKKGERMKKEERRGKKREKEEKKRYCWCVLFSHTSCSGVVVDSGAGLTTAFPVRFALTTHFFSPLSLLLFFLLLQPFRFTTATDFQTLLRVWTRAATT
jgi:hypothetical protein